jgi:hypothetical protein
LRRCTTGCNSSALRSTDKCTGNRGLHKEIYVVKCLSTCCSALKMRIYTRREVCAPRQGHVLGLLTAHPARHCKTNSNPEISAATLRNLLQITFHFEEEEESAPIFPERWKKPTRLGPKLSNHMRRWRTLTQSMLKRTTHIMLDAGDASDSTANEDLFALHRASTFANGHAS